MGEAEEILVNVVLVTGGSGFIAAYCILQLLAAGFDTRTTLRDPRREERVRQMLRAGHSRQPVTTGIGDTLNALIRSVLTTPLPSINRSTVAIDFVILDGAVLHREKLGPSS